MIQIFESRHKVTIKNMSKLNDFSVENQLKKLRRYLLMTLVK